MVLPDAPAVGTPLAEGDLAPPPHGHQLAGVERCFVPPGDVEAEVHVRAGASKPSLPSPWRGW
jgi:hypothetical protein